MFGISKHEIAEKIKSKLVTELSKEGHVKIDGVGSLQLQDDGDVKFYPDQSFLAEVHRAQRHNA